MAPACYASRLTTVTAFHQGPEKLAHRSTMHPHHSTKHSNRARIIEEITARRDRVTTHPFEIQFSGEHRCNLKCIQCGATIDRNHGIEPLMDRRLPQRSLERFLKIIHTLPDWEWLSLTGSGETLINPELPQILEKLQTDHECHVSFNTNGTLWTEERARMVVAAGVDEIRFSMDGATKETFERIRVNAKFDKVVDNIRMLGAIRDQMGATHPLISFSCNFMRQNIEELPLLVDLAADVGAVKVIANNTILYDPSMAHEALAGFQELVRQMAAVAAQRADALGIEFVDYLTLSASTKPKDPKPKLEQPAKPKDGSLQGKVNAHPLSTPSPCSAVPVDDNSNSACASSPRAQRPSEPGSVTAQSLPDHPKAEPPKASAESLLPPLAGLPSDLPAIVRACQRPWTGLYVENNGWVKVCCFDVEPIGNLDFQSLDEIWNGPHIRELRRSFLENRPPEGCRNCFIFAPMKQESDVFVRSKTDIRCNIDAPALDPHVSGNYTVHGWAVAKHHVYRVEVIIDDEVHGTADLGFDRPDVAEAIKGYPEAATSGFRYPLEASTLSAGEHRLTIRVFDRAGEVKEGPPRIIVCAH